jgi:hypothetical protein
VNIGETLQQYFVTRRRIGKLVNFGKKVFHVDTGFKVFIRKAYEMSIK